MTRPKLLDAAAGVAIAFVVATCASGPSTTHPSANQATDNSNPSTPTTRGAALYQRHCSVCHGADGDAKTPVASLLLPRPTPFREGLFKLVSTTNGMPTDDDLVRTLRRGMPGSTMMAWGWMPDDDLRALAQEVRTIALRGRTESIHRTAAIAGRPISLADAANLAARQLAPGEGVDAGERAADTPGNAAEGERLYRQHCASCHGNDGRGLPATQEWPTDGTWLWPRDFTQGYLRGEPSHRELAFRIRAGMPGAHMPPARLSTAETEAIVAHVKSLIPEAAGDHHAQWRRTIRVTRSERLPAAADDAAWQRVDAVRLPLAPLWWRPDAVDELWLRVVHDGNDIALRLEWADPVRNDTPRPDTKMGDGAAIQFARTDDPPLFAMGSASAPVNVWRWHAFDPKATAGMIDLAAPPHGGLDVPVGSAVPQPRSESLQLHGVDSAPVATGSGLALDVKTNWRDGRWTATFRRSLAARAPHEIDLAAPGPVLLAFAVWDGRIDAHPGSKAITTWHVLDLQR